MGNKEKKIIMFDSDEAAQPITVSGWKSSVGSFFVDEKLARYHGCTHKRCDCGNLMTKNWTKCENCREKIVIERYNSLPFKEWTGEFPVCLYNDDVYFFDEDDIHDYIDNQNFDNEDDEDKYTSNDLMFVMCHPNYMQPLETDIWEDILPEDGDFPKALVEKVNEFNEFLKTLKPLSWSPSNIRTKINLKED